MGMNLYSYAFKFTFYTTQTHLYSYLSHPTVENLKILKK